jgi:hypothetical protein
MAAVGTATAITAGTACVAIPTTGWWTSPVWFPTLTALCISNPPLCAAIITATVATGGAAAEKNDSFDETQMMGAFNTLDSIDL